MSAARRRYWLVKSEPSVYSIDDLERDGVTLWDGVRNYQARNTLRDEMAEGDQVLFYHSNAKPLCVAGVAEVVGESYPDPSAFDPDDSHYDPKSDPDDPTWMVVDLKHVATYEVPVERATLAAEPALAQMKLLARGCRLSVQPVTAAEFRTVQRLARAAAKGAGGQGREGPGASSG